MKKAKLIINHITMNYLRNQFRVGINSLILLRFRRRSGHQHGQDTRSRSRWRRRTPDYQVDTERRRSRSSTVRWGWQPDVHSRALAFGPIAITRIEFTETVPVLLRCNCKIDQNVFPPEMINYYHRSWSYSNSLKKIYYYYFLNYLKHNCIRVRSYINRYIIIIIF